jgi:hypothetical protein
VLLSLKEVIMIFLCALYVLSRVLSTYFVDLCVFTLITLVSSYLSRFSGQSDSSLLEVRILLLTYFVITFISVYRLYIYLSILLHGRSLAVTGLSRHTHLNLISAIIAFCEKLE